MSIIYKLNILLFSRDVFTVVYKKVFHTTINTIYY